jgi:CrcB protein
VSTRADVLLVIAAGGALGSLARYGLSLAIPHGAGQFPVATLLVNVVGCLLIGGLMATITESSRPHRLLRPFFGIGLLGGFTTFSTYAVEVLQSDPVVAVLYATATVLLALVATAAGLIAARALLRRGRFGGEHP